MRSWIQCVVLVLAFLGGAASWAAGASDTAFGSVWRLDGEVQASGPRGGERTLQLGDTVFVGDKVTAGARSEAVIQALDGGAVAVRPGASFTVVRFKADGQPTDHSALQLITGSLRIISGWIGKLNRRGSTLVTPTATVGIRGTDHEPFVLLEEDPLAEVHKAGTYDKVNQGGTTLEAAGQSVDIAPGRVGFARAAPKKRALMTLLFPVLLDRVPDFYVPGRFDDELNEWSKQSGANNQRLLQERQRQATACQPQEVARRWITALDQQLTKGNADAILDMFQPQVVVRASVRAGNGQMTELELRPTEFADSIVSAVASLKDYRHRRISIEGKPATAEGSPCAAIAVRSVVIEEGRQGDRPYRFESEEKYLLQQTDGVWRASEALTRQR